MTLAKADKELHRKMKAQKKQQRKLEKRKAKQADTTANAGPSSNQERTHT